VLSLGLAGLLMGTVTGLATPMASAVAAPADERERLATERRAVDTRHAEAVAACQLRFLVSDCVALARSQQRLALDGLRRQQLLLDDARRRDRAAERLKLQQDRAQDRAQSQSQSQSQSPAPAPTPAPRASAPLLRQPRQAAAGASAASAAAVASVASAASAASATPLKRRQAASPTAAPAAAPRAASGERQHEQAFDQRQQAAREHQRAVELRNARRDAARQPAGSLPLPTANPPLPAASSAAAASR
jgi:type IV secretory pathway VirJ component